MEQLVPLNKSSEKVTQSKHSLQRDNNSEDGKRDTCGGDFEATKRDTWGSRTEYLLAIIGYTVGIGSIWRFPIMCARNGGGAFLIPFVFFMVTCGGPLYYLEVCLGQFSGKNAGLAFEFCPLFKGLGWLMVVISFNYLSYIVVVMGWVNYYFVNSFYDPLPWTACDNWWNTKLCKDTMFVRSENINTSSMFQNSSWNISIVSMQGRNGTINETIENLTYRSSADEFWQFSVLRKSDGLENMGNIQWHLVLCNFVAWAICVAALIKGVKSLGKVVYVTATAPYILLTILLIRGLMLDGAVDGVLWYITPDFNKLMSKQVWLEAAIQVFYSLGPSWGGVISMSSHNKFKQTSIVETVIVVCSDVFTAFYAGLVVFSCIGFMSKEAGVPIAEVAKSSGPGLVFVAYPMAISRMPLPQLWAALFFLTLITISFDSYFGLIETIVGTILDTFPRQLTRYKELTLICLSTIMFLLSTPLSMNGGIYLFMLCDWSVSAFALLLGAVLEAITIAWIYGADRFVQDIKMMTGRQTSVLLRIVWFIVLPGILLVSFVTIVVTYEVIDYGDGYVYQPYAINIGLILSVLPMIPLLMFMVKGIYQTQGSLKKRISSLLHPSTTWLPNDNKAREIYTCKPYRYEDTWLKRIKTNIFGNKDTPWI